MVSSARGDGPRIPVAIAHDYLTQRGGAERVVLALARAYPSAPIYTNLYDPDGTFPEFRGLDIRPSWLNRIPQARRNHRAALPALPFASSSVVIDADVVIASSSGWAHGFRSAGAKIVYCYSPARWLYQSDTYVGERSRGLEGMGLAALGPALRWWDRRAARTADEYLAISTVVQRRIFETYGRMSTIVPAPLSLDLSQVRPEPVIDSWLRPGGGQFVLCVSRLLPYKNVDAVIEAARLRPDQRLVVVGTGPERQRLLARAPDNVLMLTGLTDGQMRWLYESAAGLIAASFEDFGLTPLEAATHGTPSAVLRGGGFLDTMVEFETAVFFDAPDPHLIAAAIDELLAHEWSPEALRARAALYSESAFVNKIEEAVRRASGVLELTADVEESK